jgi:hypothetical protein
MTGQSATKALRFKAFLSTTERVYGSIAEVDAPAERTMTKSAPWSWLLLCAAIAVSAGIWVQLGRDPASPSNSHDDAVDGRAPAQQDSRSTTAHEAASLALAWKVGETDTAAATRHAELAAMSETFREGVLLIAIREAGYRCYQLIGSSTSGGDEPIWTVTCDDSLGYVVGVDPTGAVAVEPMLIGDGVRDWQRPAQQLPVPNQPRLPIE